MHIYIYMFSIVNRAVGSIHSVVGVGPGTAAKGTEEYLQSSYTWTYFQSGRGECFAPPNQLNMTYSILF